MVEQGSDHKIRYQTLHDNKYIRYFGGHTERVTGLCLSPKSDMFLSAGQVLLSTASLLHALCCAAAQSPGHGQQFTHALHDFDKCLLGTLCRTGSAESGT